MFLVDIAKFFKKVFLYNTSGGCLWQSYHGTVNQLGCLFFVSHLHVLSILIKKFHETLLKLFFTMTWQNSFFLAWFDWSRAFYFRICFGKTLIALVFDEKRTQSVALCNITFQKNFFPQYFAVGTYFQFHGMICKTEKAVKISILILLRFCLPCSLKNHFFYLLSLL